MQETVDEKLLRVLSAIVPAAAPNLFDGDALEYITWQYSTIPVIFAESRPHMARYLVSVHLFLPNGENPNGKKLEICQDLHAAGFTYPSITNASDKLSQHYVFECEYADGGV